MNTFILPHLTKQLSRFMAIVCLMSLPIQAISADITEPLAPFDSITAELATNMATFEIASHDADAVTYNANSRNIWIYSKQRLQAFQPDGSQIVDRTHPQLPPEQANASMIAEGEKLWLVIGHILYQFDKDGSLIKQRHFQDDILAIHFDAKLSQLLVATDDYVIVLDDNGKEVQRIHTRLANIA